VLAAHAAPAGESFSLRRRGGAGGAVRLSALRATPFAVLLPSDGVVETVMSTSLNSFLNIYNTILVARLVLTWFPSAPPALVSPLACAPHPPRLRAPAPTAARRRAACARTRCLAGALLRRGVRARALTPHRAPHPIALAGRWLTRI
jgi:hypothetical protein